MINNGLKVTTAVTFSACRYPVYFRC